MNAEEFFYYLLDKTRVTYENTPISEINSKWGASVCDTTIKKGKPVLAGINWGGDKDYGIQTEYPKNDKKRDYTFLRKIPSLLEKHFRIQGIHEINYCNVCFFRSPNQKFLSKTDWKNSIPLFQEYIEYIKTRICNYSWEATYHYSRSGK